MGLDQNAAIIRSDEVGGPQAARGILGQWVSLRPDMSPACS